MQADLANDTALRNDLENFMRIYNSEQSLNGYEGELATLSDKLVAYAKTH